ncbi:MAG: NnrU family protein, partial [Burkholderiaceae bacterium]
MAVMLLGLVLFLGVHSMRIVAEDWRNATIRRIGAHPWKGAYSIISLVGFVLMIWGFGMARAQPVQWWSPPQALRHLAILLTVLSFVLLVAAYVPGNGIKARVHHPMVLSVKVWALAHLLANGNVAHVVLFGAFLVWAVFNFMAARRRDRAAATVYGTGRLSATLTTCVLGVAAWAAFVFWLHGWLI